MKSSYNPPKIWQEKKNTEGTFAAINSSTSGPRKKIDLPEGEHPLQLYSLATPNGVKVTIMLEELLEAGCTNAEYDAFPVDIQQGDQFGSDFVAINPNSKIPALLDKSNENSILRVFESGSILLYLAEKFKLFLPSDLAKRTETLNWLFWQMGSAPYLGGGFGHFYAYAPEKLEYPIDRFAMETKRQLDVLNRQLADNKYIIGDDYTIADIGIFPWYGMLVKGRLYDAGEFLSVHQYKNVVRWADELLERPAVLRGRLVNRTWGDANQQLPERHSSKDFANLDLAFRL